MKKFNSLLFELSSMDRLDILALLKETPLKLSHVSKKLDFTVQETSRNITRLSEAKIIRKDVDGEFHLTPYGTEALNLLSGFKFLFKNREYLTTHVLTYLPVRFRASIGVLECCKFVNDVMITFHNVENMIAKAQKYVWIITNQVLASTIPYLMQAVERGTEFRLLMPKDYLPSKDIRELVSNPAFRKASRAKKLESRFLERVDVFICLSENEVGALSFPNLEGKLDYIGFKSNTESVVNWSKALYSYHWEKATWQLPDQLARK
ncbi:MAG: helix-turn-helix transcriptional regulator [Candidatus Bathyarchaeia archaeon]